MPAHPYGSIGFSEALSIQTRETKEAALQNLERYFAGLPMTTLFIKDCLCEFIEEIDGLEGHSTEEIFRAELPHSQKADLEKLGFKFYPIIE